MLTHPGKKIQPNQASRRFMRDLRVVSPGFVSFLFFMMNK